MAGPALPIALLMVLGGILMLALGAAWLVEGASRLALRLGVTPMVVGLTVIGFGTSMPEFSVSVLAVARGSGGLGLGNAVGSNVMNLLMVLGVAALIAPIHVVGGRRVLRRDLLFGLLPAMVLLFTAWDGRIDRLPALALVVLFLVFMGACIRQARGSSTTRTVLGGSLSRDVALTVVGIAVVVVGAELMVRGGVSVARSFGVSEAVIGLTLLAFGTSLPELATSVAAAVKGESELSMGNVLGSNVFNLGLIVGTAFSIRPAEVPVFVIRQDLPFLVATTLVVGVFVLRDGRITRSEGAILVTAFLAYVAFIFLRGG